MPNFDRSALKVGAAAIREANESRGGGEYRPFLPSIYWKNDKDFHYLLILNAIEEIPRVDFHNFIEIEGKPAGEQVIARTEPAIGERRDPIEDQWNYKPKKTNLMIAVELEPTTQTDANGRERPTGFQVKVNEFQRRVRDDDGELTDERVDVIAPAIGFITQSPFNFGNQLESYDATEGPIHKSALKITRLGQKTNVTYQIKGYDNIEVDLTNLIENIAQVSYIQKDQATDLLEQIDGLSDDEAAEVIGRFVLDLKLDELADPERYDEILNQITKPSRYDKPDEKKSSKPERAAKPSQRRVVEEEPAGDPETELATAVEEAPKAEKPKARRTTGGQSRIQELREKSAVKA